MGAVRRGVVIHGERFKLWDYRDGSHGLFDRRQDPGEQVNLWDSSDPEPTAARESLLGATDALLADFAPLRLDSVTADYGMFAHRRFDGRLSVPGQDVFPGAIGGYDAIAAPADGQPRARSCFGGPRVDVPANSPLIGGRTGDPLDVAAVWRQALSPPQVAARHTLGNRYGYGAAQANTRFNTPETTP